MALLPGSMTWQSHSFRPSFYQLARQAFYGIVYIPPVVLKTNSVNVTCSTSNTWLVYRHFLAVSSCLNIWSGSMSLQESAFGSQTLTPLPLPEFPGNYIQPRIWAAVGSPIQLFSCDVLQKWFAFNVFTHHAKQFSLQIRQFIIIIIIILIIKQNFIHRF